MTSRAVEELQKRVKESSGFIQSQTSLRPKMGIILGTGLGELAEKIRDGVRIPYNTIQNFPQSTVEDHLGKLILGFFQDKVVVVMQGRFHYYEGYSLKRVTFPVRVMKELGINTLIISSAAGGLNPQFAPGEIMIITDHINLLGSNPLIGPNLKEWGERFPDMSEPYNKELVSLAERIALEERIRVHKGVYVAASGPSLETRAETRFLRLIGADAVGMSTVPEVIVAVQARIKVLGLSVISNLNLADALRPISYQEIVAVAKNAEPKLLRLIEGVVREL